MELVKRLEGSEPEQVDYNFEEHYLHEDEETTKRKKGTLFTIIALIIIAILGYFEFKNFNSNEVKVIDKSLIVTSLLPVTIQKVTEVNLVSSPIKNKEPKEIENKIVVQKEKLKSITPIKIEPPKIVTYTEVLAQKLKPVAIKENVKISTPNKKVAKRIVSKKSRIAIVKKGDTLARISKRFYGTSKEFTRIIQANKSIKSHKTSLKIGQKIIIPSLLKKYQVKKVSPKKTNPKKKRIITVKRGDTLNIIAQRYYGNSMKFKGIIRANKSIRSAKSSLKLGEKIIVPYLAKSQRRRFVTVKKGYSLAYISKKFYGNTSEVKRIVKANHDIKSEKSTLRIGQKVYVPR